MVAQLYPSLPPVLEEEKDRLKNLPKPMDRLRVNIPLVFTAALLGFGLSNLLLSAEPTKRNNLRATLCVELLQVVR